MYGKNDIEYIEKCCSDEEVIAEFCFSESHYEANDSKHRYCLVLLFEYIKLILYQ